jgi:hypothetical protein
MDVLEVARCNHAVTSRTCMSWPLTCIALLNVYHARDLDLIYVCAMFPRVQMSKAHTLCMHDRRIFNTSRASRAASLYMPSLAHARADTHTHTFCRTL